MNFWERVDDLIDRKGMTKVALSKQAGINPSNITKGLKANNMPAADTAVKIAEILGVSTEYLVTGKNSNKKNILPIGEKDSNYCIIKDFENLPSDKQEIVKDLIDNLKKL